MLRFYPSIAMVCREGDLNPTFKCLCGNALETV